MLIPGSTEWPIWFCDPRPSGWVAPLRHDLALAHYLEKQRARRASTARRADLGTIAIRLCVLIARVERAFFRPFDRTACRG